MKKIILMALVAGSFAACNDEKKTEVTTTATDTSMTVTPDETVSATTTASVYAPAEGDIIYRSGKVMVWRNGVYVASDNDVTLDNGIVVNRNGQATRNGVVVTMEDGETVTRSGRWYNKAGEGIDDAWDATKKGVRKAANAVEKGAKKVGEEIKDVVN